MIALDYRKRTRILHIAILTFIGIICVIWLVPLAISFLVSGVSIDESSSL